MQADTLTRTQELPREAHPLCMMVGHLNNDPAIAPELQVEVSGSQHEGYWINFWNLQVTFSADGNFYATLSEKLNGAYEVVFHGYFDEMVWYLTRYLHGKAPKWAKQYAALCAEIEKETKPFPY